MSSNIQNWVKTSPTFKVFTVLIITLILLIPAYKIEALVSERQGLEQNVISEISSKWGAEQSLTGPILTIPYLETENSGTPNEKVKTKYLNILPEKLDITGELNPKIKKRSIYKAILYSTEISLSGVFDLRKIRNLKIDTADIQWQKAKLSFGISDPRGINGIGKIQFGDKRMDTEPGLPSSIQLENGFHGYVNTNPRKEKYAFTASYSLKGSSGIHILPVGKTTHVKLKSLWKDPSFTGAFLPESHTIDSKGFEANWKILDYNRSFEQIWNDYFPNISQWGFGVELLEPVNIYQKTERSIKYAFMIIALTFTFFFFFEILHKLKIHPIQYTIVGFALLIFYLLLIALSEQMNFSLAFVISALATIVLVAYYFYFISKSIKVTFIFSLIFTFIYAFIFVILNAEAYSLLIGSIGLFALIALIMHFSRNVDWYQTTASAIKESEYK